MAVYEHEETIDKEIYSLVEILNQTGYIRTTSSCAGFTLLRDGTYIAHIGEGALPWISFEPICDDQKCSHLLEYVSKLLANAHQWGFSPPNPNAVTLSPDARESFEFYKQAGAENLFWLDKPIFYIEGQLDILPILKEGEIESLRRCGIEKLFGVVRTKEDIRKIWLLIEMAAREFECGDAIKVPAFPTLEEQIQSLKEFLQSLPYLFLRKHPDRTRQIRMDGAIYVAGQISVGDVEEYWAYPRVAAFAKHIAIRLYNHYVPQMHFCTGNILSLQEIPKVVTPHRFYEEADALSLFGSPLPLVRIYHHFPKGAKAAVAALAALRTTDVMINVTMVENRAGTALSQMESVLDNSLHGNGQPSRIWLEKATL